MAKMPLPKVPKRRGYTEPYQPPVSVVEEHQWPRNVLYEDDSEETEEEEDNDGDGARCRAASSDDDEETEDEEWAAQISRFFIQCLCIWFTKS